MLNSNKLMALAFVLSTLIFMNVSKASEQILATITTDAFTDVYQLIVDANEEDNTLINFYIDKFSNGQFKNRDELSMNIFIKEGFKFPHKGSVNFATISGNGFDKEQGGMIIINAICSILTGKRKNYELDLAKDKSGWRLFSDGQLITKINVLANKVPIIGLVGAKDLVMK